MLAELGLTAGSSPPVARACSAVPLLQEVDYDSSKRLSQAVVQHRARTTADMFVGRRSLGELRLSPWCDMVSRYTSTGRFEESQHGKV